MIWVAGYPKSGTTWLKFIVAALLYRTNKLKKVVKLIPNMTEMPQIDGIYKVLFNSPPSGKKVYIVRHPVDICASGMNYEALPSGKIKNDFVDRFIENRGNVIRDYGSWDTHVENWLGEKDIVAVKYEELISDPKKHITRIARYLGAVENIDYAVDATKFETMKKMEIKAAAKGKKTISNTFFNPKHKGYKKGMAFMNRGTSGYAREMLSEEQIAEICKIFQRTLTLLGYETIY